MKRGIFNEKERRIRKKVQQEHELFKYKMLALPAEEIYNNCNKIRFYECIYEYFQYAEDVEKRFVDACLKESNVIAVLWDLYIEYEYLKCDTWEGIEEILRMLVDRRTV